MCTDTVNTHLVRVRFECAKEHAHQALRDQPKCSFLCYIALSYDFREAPLSRRHSADFSFLFLTLDPKDFLRGVVVTTFTRPSFLISSRSTRDCARVSVENLVGARSVAFPKGGSRQRQWRRDCRMLLQAYGHADDGKRREDEVFRVKMKQESVWRE